jgi:hypothetical protein
MCGRVSLQYEPAGIDNMGNIGRLVSYFLAGLVFGIPLAGLVLAQDAGSTTPESTESSSSSPTMAPCKTCPANAPGRHYCAGQNLSQDLSLQPECWPSPCQGSTDPRFDALNSECPSKDDFFINPPRNKWYFRSEGGGLGFFPQQNKRFAAVPQLIGGGTLVNYVLSTNDFENDFGLSGNFLIGYTLNDCIQVEGVFSGSLATDGSVVARDNDDNGYAGAVGNIMSPFDNFLSEIPGLDYNKYGRIYYKSSLQGCEINIRRQSPMPPERLAVSILFGVRYIGLPEEFQYDTISDVTSSGAVVADGVRNTIHIKTHNEMVGPQIGALFELNAENRWWINFESKAALLNNHSRQTSTYTNIDGGAPVTYTSSRNDDHTAFAGELNVTFLYRWSPHFSTRLGYKALFLAELALAPDNMMNDIDYYTARDTQLNHSSSAIYHGPFAGIEVAW